MLIPGPDGVEVFYKQDEKEWPYRVFQDNDPAIELRSLSVPVEMEEIYDKVVWG